MLEEAIEEVESEGKAAVAGDLYRQAIGMTPMPCLAFFSFCPYAATIEAESMLANKAIC